MKHNHTPIIFYPLFLIVTYLAVTEGKYYIQDNDIPSYLYKKFIEIDDSIFPADIKIKLSMSRITGTLLYSIDKNSHQLIVSLEESLLSTIKMEFNKQIFRSDLSKLCGCERCRYTTLYLRIMIGIDISIECNGGEKMRYNYENNTLLNEDYPNPYLYINGNTPAANDAYLWVVNTPQYDNIYPNYAQLSGCIFEVWYNNNPINFDAITRNIQRKCIKICKNNTCNGGQCLETYNGAPVCNCRNTFRSGLYCNDEPNQLNLRSYSKNFMFEMFKLSWKGSSKEIMMLSNANVKLKLYNDESMLLYEIICRNNFVTKASGILSSDYRPNSEYIMIATFYQHSNDIQLYTNGTSSHLYLQSNCNLMREIFDNLTLSCGTGSIDLSIKESPSLYTWKAIDLEYMREFIPDGRNMSISTPIPNVTTAPREHSKSHKGWLLSGSIIVFLVLGYIPFVYFLITMKRKSNDHTKRSSENGELDVAYIANEKSNRSRNSDSINHKKKSNRSRNSDSINHKSDRHLLDYEHS